MSKIMKWSVIFIIFLVAVLSAQLTQTGSTGRYTPYHDHMGYTYLHGNAITDGSHRFIIHEVSGYPEIQVRVDGIWKATTIRLGVASLYLGENVKLSAFGHNLMVEHHDTHADVVPHSPFSDNITERDVEVSYFYNYLEKVVLQPDESEEWTGTVFEGQSTPQFNILTKIAYIKTGAVAATDNIRVCVWKGTNRRIEAGRYHRDI